MSMVAGPPASQSMMTALALRFLAGSSSCSACASSRSSCGSVRPEQAGGADLEEVAAVEAFAVRRRTRCHGAGPFHALIPPRVRRSGQRDDADVCFAQRLDG